MLVEYRESPKKREITLVEKVQVHSSHQTCAQSRTKPKPLSKVRKEHWNATHNVPAYILGKEQEVQKYSDDNEPSGTAAYAEVLKNHEVKLS